MKATIKVFLAAITIGVGVNQAMAGMVDFEDEGSLGGTDGDLVAFINEGVIFSTGSVSNTVVQGNPLPFTESSTQINLTNSSFIIGSAGSQWMGFANNNEDILMTFVEPGTMNPTTVQTVSLNTDGQVSDSADTVRLIALGINGDVLAFDEATDDDPNGTTLTVNVGTSTIAQAVFQTTTNDFEGYDNVNFSGGAPIPEPSSIAMIGAGVLLIGYGNGRKKFRA